MTDPRKAAEDALAEALVEIDLNDKNATDIWFQWEPLRLAAAILDASPALTAMLLTGAAVERLPRDFELHRLYDGLCIVTLYDDEMQPISPSHEGDTIPAAIAAALGDET